MKTKEIDVWIHENHVEHFCKALINTKEQPDHIKAKLIMPIPEKKIEITESQFDAAIRLYGSHNLDIKSYSGFVKTLKKELGF